MRHSPNLHLCLMFSKVLGERQLRINSYPNFLYRYYPHGYRLHRFLPDAQYGPVQYRAPEE